MVESGGFLGKRRLAPVILPGPLRITNGRADQIDMQQKQRTQVGESPLGDELGAQLPGSSLIFLLPAPEPTTWAP